MSDDAETRRELAPFVALKEYEAPAMPTLDTFQIWATRARELLRREPAEPMIADERLRRSTLALLDEAASPPACGPLVAELRAALAGIFEENRQDAMKQAVIMPPGDRNDVIAAWARSGGHTILPSPARSRLCQPGTAELPDLRGDGLLVIPALEDWFVRHTHGLETIRRLLSALHDVSRRVLVGCNSWAWQYLVRAVDVDAILPAPITFQAFDADRLRSWLSSIAYTDTRHRMRFRAVKSGEDVLDVSNDEPHDLLYSLAARSRGIPWVAWRLWRQSLRRRIEAANMSQDSPAETSPEDSTTLWVIALEEFSLPGVDDDDTLLLLHALLIHGPLTPTLLENVLPMPQATRRMPTLLAAGIIERREDGRVGCAPGAYPAIRAGLATAGFPVAKL